MFNKVVLIGLTVWVIAFVAFPFAVNANPWFFEAAGITHFGN